MKNPIVAIHGGLGNQLFQWFFAHSLGTNQSFLIDPLYDHSVLGDRSFELLEIIPKCIHMKNSTTNIIIFNILTRFFRVVDRAWNRELFRPISEKLGYFREDPRNNQAQSHSRPKHVTYAKGYFQKQSVVNETFPAIEHEIMPFLRSGLDLMRDKYSLADNYSVIHVRRGDYGDSQTTSDMIGVLSDDYFLNWKLTANSGQLVLLTEYVSDVQRLITQLNPDLILDKSQTSAWETLAILYGAEFLLGSNSSLSWWGARLCYERGGKVWLPSAWSIWGNIDPSDYHFGGSSIQPVQWRDGQTNQEVTTARNIEGED